MPRLDLSRVLVTGGEGMIGRALPWGIKTDQATLDICKPGEITAAVERYQPAAVLHLAAIDIHAAERDVAQALAVNVMGTYHIAGVAATAKLPVIFVSSGAVFAGKRDEVHDELALPAPRSVFGQTKLAAESLLHRFVPQLLTIRTGWLFGGNQAHHKKFVEIAIEKARRNEPIEATADQWGSPTGMTDFVATLGELIEKGQTGTVHVVNSGAASRYEMALEIVQQLHSTSKVLAKTYAELSPDGPPRGESEVLVSRQITLRPWQEALREYIGGS
jgi:dTDP-4-dehydrorhamnose reductase